MSEYQFYEFQAIDQALSPEDKKYVQSLSSRAKVTTRNAQFFYNYGNFRDKPEELLDRYFDLYIYVANFGIRQLMIRFPKELVNPKIFEPYCVEDLISVTTTKKSIILDISIVREDYYGWLEETSHASDLASLRQEILEGDLRLPYLAWLAAGFAEEAPESLEDAIEPPVPANLQQLSPALIAFAELFQINSDLINAAAIESPTSKQHPEQNTSPGRTLAALMSSADQDQNTRENQAHQAAIVARQKYLKTLEPKADAIWEKVIRLVEFKQSKPYDEAVAHLVDLRDLAEMQEDLVNFTLRLVKLKEQCNNRSGLIARLKKAGLSS